MKKRIFRNTMLVMFFVVALCGVLILGVLYDHFTDELQDELLDCIVTPRNIDVECAQIVSILSQGINQFIHPSYERL